MVIGKSRAAGGHNRHMVGFRMAVYNGRISDRTLIPNTKACSACAGSASQRGEVRPDFWHIPVSLYI